MASAPATHEQLAAVGEARPVGRIELAQTDEVGHVGAGGSEGGGQQVRHRHHGRAGVEAVPVAFLAAGPTAGAIAALDDLDVPPSPGEVACRGQPAQAGTDHHHAARHRCRHATWVQSRRRRVRCRRLERAAIEGVDGLCHERLDLPFDGLRRASNVRAPSASSTPRRR